MTATWVLGRALICTTLISIGACRGANQSPEIAIALQHVLAEKPPTPIATALEHLLAGKPPTPIADVWTDVRAFYAARQNAPAWVADRNASKATAALQVLRTAPEHGFGATDYDEAGLTADVEALKNGNDDANRVERLAVLDARITTALLALGRDIALGRSTPASIDRQWKARRQAPDFAGLLVQAADGDPTTWPDAVRPQHPEYAALEKVLSGLHAQRDKGGWPIVPSRMYKIGEEDPSVVTLRERLTASGNLSAAGATSGSAVYAADIDAAVRSFQAQHGIKATGLVDKTTLAAMNVPIDDRIRQVEINLERWRWMPGDFGARHFLVNIPSFMLMAREDGKTALEMRVVVGKPGHETPIFSGDMANVVFSPYWNVPDSIAEDETAPLAARDPGYLTRNNMEVFRGTTRVDESEVNWGSPDELRKLVFRQRPGAGNALGRVKFLFPNPYNVYLHDTPAQSLFARTGRAFSHGCVRVEEPEALAKYVLRGDAEWDEPRMLAAMRSGVEKYVRLKETIPVHIVYFTVWVDERNAVHFLPDVYGYDDKQMKLSAIPD